MKMNLNPTTTLSLANDSSLRLRAYRLFILSSYQLVILSLPDLSS
jgi:hypothetical protein